MSFHRATNFPTTLLAAWLLVPLMLGCGSKHPTSSHRTGSVSGTVVNSVGGPEADADVYLTSSFEVNGTRELFIAFTNAQGRYSFGNLVPGAYVVEATTVDFRVAADSLSIPSGALEADTLDLVAGGIFTGTVTLSGAVDHRGTILSTLGIFTIASTDSTGRYRLDAIPPGRWTVEAFHPNYVTTTLIGILPAAADSVELSPLSLSHSAGAP
jgi:hypothetical protein